MTSELKPCPFCGGAELSSGGDDKFVGYFCGTCQAAGPNHYGSYDWNTRSTPSADTMAGLVRYKFEVSSEGHPFMGICNDGSYVLHSEAAAVVAAKDARIVDGEQERQEMAKGWFNFCELIGADIDSHEAVASYVRVIKERAEAAEAELDKLKAQEPVAEFGGRRHEPENTNEFFGFLNNGIGLLGGTPLYASPVSDSLKAECERYKRALTKIASFTQSTDLLWWQVEARAALNAEASPLAPEGGRE